MSDRSSRQDRRRHRDRHEWEMRRAAAFARLGRPYPGEDTRPTAAAAAAAAAGHRRLDPEPRLPDPFRAPERTVVPGLMLLVSAVALTGVCLTLLLARLL